MSRKNITLTLSRSAVLNLAELAVYGFRATEEDCDTLLSFLCVALPVVNSTTDEKLTIVLDHDIARDLIDLAAFGMDDTVPETFARYSKALDELIPAVNNA